MKQKRGGIKILRMKSDSAILCCPLQSYQLVAILDSEGTAGTSSLSEIVEGDNVTPFLLSESCYWLV